MGVLKKMIAISRTELILREHHLDSPAYSQLYGAKLIMHLYTHVPVSTPPGKRQIASFVCIFYVFVYSFLAL